MVYTQLRSIPPINANRAGGGGRGGDTSCTPSIDFKKIRSQNAIKHAKRNPPRFSHNPKYPLSKRLRIHDSTKRAVSRSLNVRGIIVDKSLHTF